MAGTRPWKRGSSAARLANTQVPASGEVGVDDDGNMVVSDGVTAWQNLKRLVRFDEVTSSVQQYVTSLVVTNSSLTALATETGYVYAIMDASGRVAIGVKPDGGTVVAKLRLADGTITFASLDPSLQARVATAIATEAGYPFAITDALGRAALRVRNDGVVDALVTRAQVAASLTPADSLIETVPDGSGNRQLWRVLRVGGKRTQLTSSGDNHTPVITAEGRVLFRQIVSGITKDKVTALTGGPIYPAASLLDTVRCFGDSLTAGVGGSAGGWPTRLATLLGTVPTANYGIGGQTTQQIVARQGGAPATATSAVTIPAGTGTVIVPVSIDTLSSTGGSATAVIAGIPGTLTRAAGTYVPATSYTFARTTAGSSTPVAAGTPLYHQTGLDSESSVQIIWTGRNDLEAGSLAPTIPGIDAGIGFLKPYAKKHLILGTTGATNEPVGSVAYNQLAAHNQSAAAKYGDSFFDVNRYLITSGLTDAGITPTTQDTTDIANDIIPTSLRAPSDRLHFNDTAYQLIAQQIYNRIVSKGWLA